MYPEEDYGRPNESPRHGGIWVDTAGNYQFDPYGELSSKKGWKTARATELHIGKFRISLGIRESGDLEERIRILDAIRLPIKERDVVVVAVAGGEKLDLLGRRDSYSYLGLLNIRKATSWIERRMRTFGCSYHLFLSLTTVKGKALLYAHSSIHVKRALCFFSLQNLFGFEAWQRVRRRRRIRRKEELPHARAFVPIFTLLTEEEAAATTCS